MDRPEKDNLEFELNQYLDGQVGGRRARRLERELQQDPELQGDLKKYAALDGMLSGLARTELAGVNYDSQRAEVVRLLERRRLLDRPQWRPVFLRPIFAVGGGLAVAAALVVGIVAWMHSHPVGAPVTSPKVFAALVAPKAAPEAQVQVALPRLDERDFRFADAPVDSGAVDSGLAEVAVKLPPPGTVMVSVEPRPLSEWASGGLPFLMEF